MNTTAWIIIKITDADDLDPVFEYKKYNAVLLEHPGIDLVCIYTSFIES